MARFKQIIHKFLLAGLLLASAPIQVIAQVTQGSGPVPVPFNPAFSIGGLFGGPAGQVTATGVIFAIINIALWIVGLLSVLFVIIGGFRYVTAHGNEEQAEGAKKTLTDAIIGVVIVILSFVIIRIIANALVFGSAGT